MSRRGKFRANVLRLADVGAHTGIPSSDPFFHDHLILAEGDSWFSIGGFPPTNLLYGLRFKTHTMVVSCAEPGDTILNMAKLTRNAQYKRALSRNGYPWDLILLSGGGNDLIDAAGKIVRKPSERRPRNPSTVEGYVKKSVLAGILKDVKQGYRDLAAVRDRPQSQAQGKPIVTHTYDYATPRNEPARFVSFPLLGPWLYKAFTENEVPMEQWLPLARYLIDALAQAIESLQKGNNRITNFHVVDTRGTLTPPRINDIGPTTHWLNEIHPNHDGYSILGKKIEREKLYGLLYVDD